MNKMKKGLVALAMVAGLTLATTTPAEAAAHASRDSWCLSHHVSYAQFWSNSHAYNEIKAYDRHTGRYIGAAGYSGNWIQLKTYTEDVRFVFYTSGSFKSIHTHCVWP